MKYKYDDAVCTCRKESPIQNHRDFEQKLDRIKLLYANGDSLEEISRKVSLYPDTIFDILNNAEDIDLDAAYYEKL